MNIVDDTESDLDPFEMQEKLQREQGFNVPSSNDTGH